jgi:low molecular weight protein-tyrosine phosphatase
MSLPRSRPYRITVVCLGNICRSPIGEAVLRQRLAEAGLADLVAVDSAGTGDWHLGHPADPRTLATLDRAGYPHEHVARQIAPHWMDSIDLLLAMDEANFRDLEHMRGPADAPELRMLRSFDPQLQDLPEPHPDLVVPDPYYGGPEGFDEVLRMIERAVDGLVDDLRDRRLAGADRQD